MTTNFTASNGITIRSLGYPHNVEVASRFEKDHWSPVGGYVEDTLMDAAMAEWYAHRRDQELGRWRDPGNPDLVIYPNGDDAVCVFSESTGSCWDVLRSVATRELPAYSTWVESAARYFAANPEPKPWHDAQPGEVWLLDIKGDLGREAPAVVNGQPEFRTYLGEYFDLSDPQIVHATRIWPEETNDE